MKLTIIDKLKTRKLLVSLLVGVAALAAAKRWEPIKRARPDAGPRADEQTKTSVITFVFVSLSCCAWSDEGCVQRTSPKDRSRRASILS